MSTEWAHDHNKSIVYHERQLSIAEEIKDLTLEAEALHGIGGNHRRMGDYHKAMEYLEHALVALSELEDGIEQAQAQDMYF